MATPPPVFGKAPAPAQPKEEEEDLDELDDLLDQFTPAPPSVPSATKPAAEPTNPPPDAFSEEFETALAREMEAMMRGAEGPGGPSPKSTEEMTAAWQKMLIGELEGTNDPESLDDLLKSFDVGANPSASTSAAPAPSSSAPGTDDAFQQTVRQAMDKLKASDANARSGAESETESFAQLLKQLGEMGGGEGGEGDEGLQGMIENMMGQLMGKEILHEPLVELDAKFPGYFDEHPELSEKDKTKFKSQQALVKKIVAVFEQPNYSDDNLEMSKEILELMNQMQELGSPPAEILGDMPPGFDLNAEGMPKIPDMENCVIA
ncbi:Peroxisome chaperone and import receptor [Ceratobasidium sp. 414]|nr:Peroxisome chaperone and import receptor [Ceratobasidium sp. 414]